MYRAAEECTQEAREHLDGKMAQQFMLQRRPTQPALEREGAGSHISEINFYQDSQDNNQFQNENCTRQDLGSAELVVLDVDKADLLHQGSEWNRRETVLANKRSNTAYAHNGGSSTITSANPLRTRARYNKLESNYAA